MHPGDGWVENALKHRPILEEYCQLAMCPTLSEDAATRLGTILRQAETDPLLSWLLDEADHILAHLQNLIHDEKIQQQQQQLGAILDALWLDELVKDLRPEGIPRFRPVSHPHS